MSETLPTTDADETAALDLLETKIIAIVDQFQKAKAHAADLEAKVEELEETVSQLRNRSAAAEKTQKSVRGRVESLLERIESIA